MLKKTVVYLKESLGIEFPAMGDYESERKVFEVMRERNVQRNVQLAEDVKGK